MTHIHHDPTLAQAVHDTATKRLDTPDWEHFPITLLDNDLELGKRAFEVLRSLGYAKETPIVEDGGFYKVYGPEAEGYTGDWIHPRAKEYLVEFGKEYVECLEAYMRLTNQPIQRL
jgi:hypothetical protein